MPDLQDVTENQLTRRSGLIGAFVIGYAFTCLIALPICLFSLQRGIAVGMIFAPLFTFLAYNLGGLRPFVEFVGLLLATLCLATLDNIFPISSFLPAAPESDSVDSATQSEIDTRTRILETESDSEFERLASILRVRHRFIRNRRIVFIVGFVIAAIGTALIQWDAMRLRQGKGSIVVPIEWKNVKAGGFYYAFPVIFVLFSVPLCIAFASYPVSFALACVGGSLYFGTAFYLLFQASLPEMSFWILPLAIFVVVAAIGLVADWVTAESGPQDTPSFG
jgi:hypothetical protein